MNEFDKINFAIIFASLYIIGVVTFFVGHPIVIGFLLLISLIVLLKKNVLSGKKAIVLYSVFALALTSCHFRIKNFDDLSQYLPTEAKIVGKVISIPTTNNPEKTKFYLSVRSIDSDKGKQTKLKAKTLVTILGNRETLSDIKIADEIELKGKLRIPFSASNPSQFDYRSYLKNHSTYSVFYVGENDWKILSEPKDFGGKFLQKLNDERTKIIDVQKKYMKSPNLEVLGGIVFGDDAINPPDEIKNSFINSGLLHILAASGMNVSIIFGIWFFIATRFRLNYRFVILAGMFLVAFYTLMTGMGPSVLRAALMIEFVLLGKLLDRSADSLGLVFLVAMFMLMANPAMINDVGFQLSFVVTFALLYYFPSVLEKFDNKFVSFCIGVMLVPFVAQLFAAPIQMFYFNTFATYSFFANLVITPFIMVISFLGFIGSICAMLPWEFLGENICYYFSLILNPFVSGLVNVSDFFSSLPNSLITTVHPPIAQMILYYVALLLLGLCIRNSFQNKKIKIGLLVFIILFTLSFVKLPLKSCDVLVFDVGNADSFLIKTPMNKYIMIDTAHGRFGENQIFSQADSIMGQYLKDAGIKSLELLVLTHFDSDHSGGAIDIMKSANVEKVLLSKYKDDSKTTLGLFDYLRKRKVKTEIAQNNKTLYEENGFKLTSFVANVDVPNSENENSTVVLLSYGDFDILFMADAGVVAFDKIKNNLPKNKIEILKSGHHGAGNTVSDSMLDLLKPDIAVISTGPNFYGHPVQETSYKLAKNNVEILRTDVNNAIKICANKNSYKVFTYDAVKRKFVKN